ncbi:uncharacterized protein [Solanum lycopersicum]|uniref:uncharacterized protein n=1 Tax=Solanum lycopersicum TaxID=4081 RepID=UPI003747822C
MVKKKKAADTMLIVGGGPTGVELATEIAVDFPLKKVTSLHKRSKLREFIGPKVPNKTLEWLKKKNVEVKLMQSFDLSNNMKTQVETECISVRLGKLSERVAILFARRRHTKFKVVKGDVLKDRIDNFGRLKVDENLRINGL